MAVPFSSFFDHSNLTPVLWQDGQTPLQFGVDLIFLPRFGFANFVSSFLRAHLKNQPLACAG